MSQLAADEKTCPYCAETIKAAARVCKHCGRDQPGIPQLPPTYTDAKGRVWHEDPPRTTTAGATFGRLVLVCIVGPLVLFFLGATTRGATAWHLGLLMLALGIGIYFLPSYEAWARSHPNFTGVFLLNLLLGWTLLGWVVALVWGASAGRRT